MTEVSLTDVARLAEVSKSTASRTFTRPELVTRRTRQRVLRAADDLGYRTATGSERVGAVGLFVPDIANPFFAPLIKAVHAEASRHQHVVVVVESDEHTNEESEAVNSVIDTVSGLILASPRMDDQALQDLAMRSRIVLLFRESSAVSNCIVPGLDGYTQAIAHLHTLGHQRVVYLAGPHDSYSNEARRQTLNAAALSFGIDLVELGPFEPRYEAGARAADLVLSLGVTAAVAYNDLIALGLLSSLQSRGVRIGQDISVVGIDNSWLGEISNPPLTSVHVPGPEAATMAVRILLASPETPPGQRSIPPTRLVVRSSTGPAKA
ncbi:LacI family DNA-binding transcriptional regulator [Angustibacter luteus]|uniref:LacI family DNA-binding transcriptional regulator n=1 Tax=Angustibacter luteus TaxID=658456 RepID=A0ABW1JHZ8_9ACTN